MRLSRSHYLRNSRLLVPLYPPTITVWFIVLYFIDGDCFFWIFVYTWVLQFLIVIGVESRLTDEGRREHFEFVETKSK